jgi:hypothetical protein
MAKGFPDDDLVLKNGGWVRVWPSVDMRGLVCVQTCETVFCNRMTLRELGKLITILKRVQKTKRKAATND